MKKSVFLFLLWQCLGGPLWAMGSHPPENNKQTELDSVKLSLGLMESYDLAFKRSETLAIKKEEVGRTLGSFLEATGEAIGDFDYVSTDARQDPQKNLRTSASSTPSNLGFERRQSQFQYSQPLFQGFRALGALSGAGSLRNERKGDWERAKQLLFMDVVSSFYDYLRLEQDRSIIKEILSLFDDRIKDLKRLEDIGRSRPSESASSVSKFENFKAELARTEGAMELEKNSFAFLIGMMVDAAELKDEKIPLPEDQQPDIIELVQNRPDVQASKQAITTARGALIIAQSGLWPKVTLDANLYQHREGIQSGTSWDTLVTMRVPLGKGGTTLGGVRDSLADWREAKLTASLTERTAEKEIRNAFANWKSTVERHEALEKAQKAAQENYTLQNDDYKRSLVNNLDVLDALQTLFETKRATNQALYEMKKNYWLLEVAKGNCCSEDTVIHEMGREPA